MHGCDPVTDFLFPFALNMLWVIIVAGGGCIAVSIFPYRYMSIVWGTLFFTATVLTMQSEIYIEPGRFVDFRIIPMTLAGFAGVPVVAVLTAMANSAYRISIGGAGTIDDVSAKGTVLLTQKGGL